MGAHLAQVSVQRADANLGHSGGLVLYARSTSASSGQVLTRLERTPSFEMTRSLGDIRDPGKARAGTLAPT